MAESPRKRFREEETSSETLEDGAEIKRQRSFHQILSILESEEDEPTQDLSSLVTTLQQELSSPNPLSDPLAEPTQLSPTQPDPTSTSSSSSSFSALVDEEEEEVLRHLLEASDDDLGIPQPENGGGVAVSREGSEVFTYDEIWELEDVAANYYTWLQSELFM